MLHKSASLTKVWRFLSGGGGRDRAAPCRGFLSTLLRSSSEIVISLNLGMPSERGSERGSGRDADDDDDDDGGMCDVHRPPPG